MMRIKNEARWIGRVIAAQLPLVSRMFILDDHSTDGTPEICEGFENVTVIRSPFEGLDETRDKDFLMQRLYDAIPEPDQYFSLGNAESPYWAVCLDGDEELLPAGIEQMRRAAESNAAHSYSVRILYAWNSAEQIRVDGVYRKFVRPSMFRLMNQGFRFKTTPWGGNLHCSSIPQELIGGSRASDAAVLHYGYIDADLRRRKYEFYNRVDPENQAEDMYRHMVIGDLFPPDSRFRYGGPIELEPLSKVAA